MELKSCLACGNNDLEELLNFGEQPPVNRLLLSPDEAYKKYPVVLNHCKACSHCQLSVAVDPKELFQNYLYASGTSKTLRDYFSWFADGIKNEFPPDAKILEIACNDGSLLKELKQRGFHCCGVEPDEALAQEASLVAPILNAFWPNVETTQKFDLIVAMNVLAHVASPLEFLAKIRETLAPGGACFIQTSHGDMLQTGIFDTIYHEHVSYFTRQSMEILAARAGMYVCSTYRLDIHGKSDGFVLRRPADPPSRSTSFLAQKPYGLGAVPAISSREIKLFGLLAKSWLEEIKYRLEIDQRPVIFVGAAAKAIVIMQAARIIPNMIVDEAPLKINKWIPGTRLQIQPMEDLNEITDPCLIVISAWNYKEELCAKVRRLMPGRDIEFMVYFPTLEYWTDTQY